MPTLRRVHLSCCGNPQYARFEDLNLSFVDEQGNAEHHLLALLNGGGKTTLLSLILSCLRPQRQEFLAYLAKPDGKPRRGAERGEKRVITNIESYVLDRDLAVVTTEWSLDEPGTGHVLKELGDSLVIGQVLQWRNRKRTNSHDDLRRGFFHFRTVPGRLTFDHVPVKGLNASGVRYADQPNATLFEHVRQWYREAAQANPSSETDGHLIDGVTAWSNQLGTLGIDSQLFAMQVKLNASGITKSDELRIGTPHDFTKILFRIGMDQALAKDPAESLRSYREEWRRREQLITDIDYLRQVLERSTRAVGEAEAIRAAEKEVANRRREAMGLGIALNTRIAQIDQQRKATDEAHAVASSDHQRLATETENLQAHERWLARRGLELGISESLTLEQEARKSRDQASTEEVIAKAAIEHRRHLAAARLQRELEDALDATLQPLLERRRHAAADLVASCAAELLKEQKRRKDLTGDQSAADKSLTELNRRRDDQIGLLTKAAEALAAIAKRLEARTRALADLRTKVLLSSTDEPDAARDQASAAIEDLDRDLAKLTTDDEGMGGEIASLLTRRETCNAEISRLERDHDRKHSFVVRGENDRARLTSIAVIREASDSATPDLTSPLLGPGLERRRGDLHGRHAIVTNFLRDDEAARDHLEHERILPPPRDIQRVLDHLKGTPVFSAYAFLQQNVSDPSEAARWLAGDPLGLAGILVDDAVTLALSIDRCRGGVPGLTGPVRISVKPDVAAGPAPMVGEVVLPAESDYGRFNATAARSALPELEHRIADHKTAIEDARGRIEVIGSAITDLERYQQTFGGGRLEQAIAEVKDLATSIGEKRSALVEIIGRQEALETDRATLRQRAQSMKARRGKLEATLRELERFLAKHGAKDAVDKAQVESSHAEEQRKECERQIASCASELSKISLNRDAIIVRVNESEQRLKHVKRISVTAEADATGLTGNPMHLPDAQDAHAASVSAYREVEGQNDFTPRIVSARQEAESHARERDRLLGNRPRTGLAALAAEDEDQLEHRAVAAAQKRQVAESEAAAAKAMRDTLEAQLAPLRAEEPNPVRPEDSIDPPTALDADTMRDIVRTELAVTVEKRDAAAKRLVDLTNERTRLREVLSAAKPLSTTIKRALEIEVYDDVAAPDLPDAAEALEDLVTRGLDAFTSANNAFVSAKKSLVRLLNHFAVAVSKSNSELRRQIEIALGESTPDDTITYVTLLEALQPLLLRHREIMENERDQAQQRFEALVGSIVSLGETALRLVSDTERESSLPDNMDAWSGQRFLRFSMSVADGETARARVAEFISTWCASTADISTEDLIDRSFYALTAEGFQVHIFKPESVLTTQRHSVDSMGGWSDGERLTMVIVIYSILARMRSMMLEKTGQSNGMGDVLFLDNPIGEASRGSLIEVQHRIARQLGLQLVCTTGIMDPEVLAHFRCRTFLAKRRSAKTGRDYVVKDDDQKHEDILGGLLNIRKAVGRPDRA